MAWNDHARADFAKAMRTGRVTNLNARDWHLYSRPIALNFGGGSASTAGYTLVDTVESVPLPVYSEQLTSTAKLKGIILCRVASASIGHVRLEIPDLSLVGADSGDITATGSNVDTDVEIEFAASTTPQVVDLEIYVKNDSGVLTYASNNPPRASFWFEVA